MSQLHFYVPDEIEQELRNAAERAGLPISRYLAELMKREMAEPPQWPEGYFEKMFGGWQGEPLERPPQEDYEQRGELG